jgi:hypothetical protein
MTVVPIVILPGLMLIAGLGMLFTGESPGWGIVFTVIGGIWSYAWYVAPNQQDQ